MRIQQFYKYFTRSNIFQKHGYFSSGIGKYYIRIGIIIKKTNDIFKGGRSIGYTKLRNIQIGYRNLNLFRFVI